MMMALGLAAALAMRETMGGAHPLLKGELGAINGTAIREKPRTLVRHGSLTRSSTNKYAHLPSGCGDRECARRFRQRRA